MVRVERLYQRDDSRFLSALLHEVDAMEDSPKKDEAKQELDKLRFVGFGVKEHKLSNIEDLLGQLIILAQALGGVEDLPEMDPAYRPAKAADVKKAEEDEVIDFIVMAQNMKRFGVPS